MSILEVAEDEISARRSNRQPAILEHGEIVPQASRTWKQGTHVQPDYKPFACLDSPGNLFLCKMKTRFVIGGI